MLKPLRRLLSIASFLIPALTAHADTTYEVVNAQLKSSDAFAGYFTLNAAGVPTGGMFGRDGATYTFSRREHVRLDGR